MSTEKTEIIDFTNYKEELEWNNYDFSEGDSIIVRKTPDGQILKSTKKSGENAEGKSWAKDQISLYVEFNTVSGWMNINKKILKTLVMASKKNVENLVGLKFGIVQIADPIYPHIVFKPLK